MSDGFNFGAVRTAEQIMARVPEGQDLVKALTSLGVWHSGANPTNPSSWKPFPKNVADLTPSQLGNENGYWRSELGRITSMLGSIDAARLLLKFKVKKAEASAHRALLSEKTEDSKKRTVSEVKVLIDADLTVNALQEQLVFLDVLFTALSAVKEAFEGYTMTLSREITRVGDLMKNGI